MIAAWGTKKHLLSESNEIVLSEFKIKYCIN